MTGRVQVVAIVGSILLLLLVLELVRRRQLAEEFSALWIASALVLLAVSVRRDLIDRLARALDIYYAPAVLLLGLLAIVTVASLSFSVILSRQQRRLDHLTEETAILAAELREFRRAREASEDVPAARDTTTPAVESRRVPSSSQTVMRPKS